VLAAMGDGVAIEGPDHRIIYQNPAHMELFGDKTGIECSLATPLNGIFCPLSHLGDGETAYNGVLTRKGSRDLEFSSFPLVSTEGEQFGGVSVVRDMTEKNAMMGALRESELLYRALVDNISMGITLISKDYRVIMANAAQGRTFNCNPSSFLGKHCYREFEKRDGVCLHCPGTRAMASGKPDSQEIENLMPNGEVMTFLLQAFPFMDKNGETQGFIEVVENITEAKKTSLEKQKLEARLLQNQKMESLGILAGGIAHDFNNLLMGIVGNIDMALSKAPPESPVRPYLQRIDATAQRASDLTNQMLAYSGRGKFIVEPIKLSLLVEEMSHLLETVISKRAILKLSLAQNLPPIDADATQLRQVIMNLIINASDAIGQRSGVITITTGLVNADKAYLSTTHLVETLTEGFYVFLEVADTGCGMDKESCAKIFDPFYTTKYTGRGLGLAAVLGIVRGHMGAIKVYSELSKGSTFKLLFPVSARHSFEEEQQSALEAPKKADSGKGKTVLVVDDDETVRSMSKMMLEDIGYYVLTAEDGLKGLEIFRECPDAIDVVLLDLTMPHMDGDETFRLMRTIRADIPVIMSSGYNEQDAVSRFAGKNIGGFLQKPYRMKDLVAAFEKVALKSGGIEER
ncbi:response regulator, partial [bacterium]